MEIFPPDMGECTKEVKCIGTESSITGNLERKKACLEKDLQSVNEALDALKANPQATP